MYGNGADWRVHGNGGVKVYRDNAVTDSFEGGSSFSLDLRAARQ